MYELPHGDLAQEGNEPTPVFQRDSRPDPREGVLGHDAFASRTSVRALTVPHDLLSEWELQHLSLQRY